MKNKDNKITGSSKASKRGVLKGGLKITNEIRNKSGRESPDYLADILPKYTIITIEY